MQLWGHTRKLNIGLLLPGLCQLRIYTRAPLYQWVCKNIAHSSFLARTRKGEGYQTKPGLKFVLLVRAGFCVCFFMFRVYAVLFLCFCLSVPMQLFARKDSSPKYMLSGTLNPTHSLTFSRSTSFSLFQQSFPDIIPLIS